MDNVYEISLLLDFYGQMLTTRQHEILDLHYNNDYSLGEIAQHLSISRQGVYDNIKRGKDLLKKLEKKLGLVKKFSEQKEKAERVLKVLQSIDTETICFNNKQKLEEIEIGIREIINRL